MLTNYWPFATLFLWLWLLLSSDICLWAAPKHSYFLLKSVFKIHITYNCIWNIKFFAVRWPIHLTWDLMLYQIFWAYFPWHWPWGQLIYYFQLRKDMFLWLTINTLPRENHLQSCTTCMQKMTANLNLLVLIHGRRCTKSVSPKGQSSKVFL